MKTVLERHLLAPVLVTEQSVKKQTLLSCIIPSNIIFI